MGGWAAWGVGRPLASGLRGPPTGEPVQLPRRAALRAACLRGRDPLVPVVEATYPTMGVYGSGACRAQVHGTKHRRVLVDPEMRPIPVVIRQVLAEQPPKMLVVENDDVVEQVAPYRPHESLGHPVLPRALVARPRGLEPHRLDRGDHCSGEDRVAVEHQVSRAAARVVEGERLPQLLHHPWRRRTLRDAPVHDLAPGMLIAN